MQRETANRIASRLETNARWSGRNTFGPGWVLEFERHFGAVPDRAIELAADFILANSKTVPGWSDFRNALREAFTARHIEDGGSESDSERKFYNAWDNYRNLVWSYAHRHISRGELRRKTELAATAAGHSLETFFSLSLGGNPPTGSWEYHWLTSIHPDDDRLHDPETPRWKENFGPVAQESIPF